MKPVESYCEKALEMEIDGARVVDSRSIVTAEWVRMKCQFGCPGFGRSICCPPHSPSPETTRKVIDGYQKAILLHRRVEPGKREKGFSEAIVRLEIEIFLEGYYKAWSMGSGPCDLCKECDPSGLCRHGYKARPSMEACGIDVFKTARDNGFPIEVVRAHKMEKNLYGVILVE
jgi:predicted metal-binding protein